MSNKSDKAKLSSTQLIIKMRDEKGITFKYVDEHEADVFLSERNNYLRTAAYRKLFPKHQLGPNANKYIDLDFAYLKELSIIDMHFRFLIMQMCSDIERALCNKINSMVEADPTTDGYDIVFRFLNANQYKITLIERGISSPYIGDLICRYFTVQPIADPITGKIKNKITAYNDCPSWVLTEVMTLGDIIDFYKFYCDSRGIPSESTNVLQIVRALRNGAAHNNCLLVNINKKTAVSTQEISNAVAALGTVAKSQRHKKLSSRSVLEFTTLLYEYDRLVKGDVRKKRIQQINELFRVRMIRNKEYFINNPVITTTYEFVLKMIDGFLPSV